MFIPYLLKKIRLSVLFCLCFLVSSCSQTEKHINDSGPVVLSMNRMIHDCVSRIVGGNVKTIVLIDGSIDPHSYEMVKGDEDKFAESSLIFCNGLGLEHSLSLRKHLEHNPKVVNIASKLISSGVFLPLQEEGFYDAHIWMDMSIWREGAREISKALIKAFPEWEDEFVKNTDILLQEMQELDSWAKQCLVSIPKEKRYLVSGHNAFSYFTKRYLSLPEEVESGIWVERCCSPEGVSPEAQISIRDIIRVADYIRKYQVEVIFPEDTLNQDSLKKIVSCLKKDWVVRLSKEPLYSDNVKGDYLQTFRHNVQVVTKELGGVVVE